MAAMRVDMIGLINGERARAGAALLRLDPTLNAIAQGRSQDMIDRDYFSHLIPGVGYIFSLLDRAHVGYRLAGENIALNNYAALGPSAAMRRTNGDFMASPEHRDNLLQPRYREIGLGVAVDPATGKTIVTEDFIQP